MRTFGSTTAPTARSAAVTVTPPPTLPDAATAHRLSARAMGWLGRERRHGAFPAGATGELADPDGVYKPLGESALAASLVLREGVAGPNEARVARELLDFAWHELREGDLLYERQLRHPLMTDPLEMYAHFARCGYHHTDFARLAAHLTQLRSWHAVELLPNRQLAVANAAHIAGLTNRRDEAPLTDATWLGATPEPWAMDWMTAYTVTHTVFHLTDWGSRPDELPQPLAAYLSRWLPVWVEVWTEIAEWDLVAELLIVDMCLDRPVCGAKPWEALLAAQRGDGLLPRDAAEVSDDPATAFEAHHHPTVVATVAGAIALSRVLGATAGTP